MQAYRVANPESGKQDPDWRQLIDFVNKNAPWGNGEGLTPDISHSRDPATKKAIEITDQKGETEQVVIEGALLVTAVVAFVFFLPSLFFAGNPYYGAKNVRLMPKVVELRYQIGRIFASNNMSSQATLFTPAGMSLKTLVPSFAFGVTLGLLPKEKPEDTEKVLFLALKLLGKKKGETVTVVYAEKTEVTFMDKRVPRWPGLVAFDSANKKRSWPSKLSKVIVLPSNSKSLLELDQLLKGTHPHYTVATT